MEFTFNHAVESAYRVDFYSVTNRQELTVMQTRLNQWLTAKTLVKYKTTIVSGTEMLFEVIRMKGDE